MDEREIRIADNEALFREVNERASELNAGWDAGGALGARFSILCECADGGCVEPVALTRAEYEEVRRHGGRFVVRPGHEVLDVERVVAAYDDWLVVEKTGPAKPYVEGLDPRRADSE